MLRAPPTVDPTMSTGQSIITAACSTNCTRYKYPAYTMLSAPPCIVAWKCNVTPLHSSTLSVEAGVEPAPSQKAVADYASTTLYYQPSAVLYYIPARNPCFPIHMHTTSSQ